MKIKRGFGFWVHGILFLIVLSWGFNNIVMKIAFQYVTAPQFSGLRILMAFPFMLYFAFWMPGRVRFTKQDIFRIMGLGIIGMGVFQILYPVGIDQTSASLGGILMATMPIHVVILSLACKLERPEWKSIVGVLLTVAGLGLITIASHQPEIPTKTTLTGIICIVLAELGYAINTTFLRPYMKRYPPLQVTGLAMSGSFIIIMVVYFSDMSSIVLSEIHPIGWMCILYSSLIAFLLANILWNMAIHTIGSSKVAVYGNLPPVLVIILSAIIFHDVLNSLQMVGAIIILSGVLLVQLRKPEEPTLSEKIGSPIKAYKTDIL